MTFGIKTAMVGQRYIDSTRRYLDYIEEHLENVRLALNEVSKACEGMAWVSNDADWFAMHAEVERHDLSKFSKEEFVQYRDFFFPVDEDDKKNSGFGDAWAHHKEMNHHHHETAETWMDVVHMVIDWTAMGYKFGDTAEAYYNKNSDRIKLSHENYILMQEIFRRLRG